LLRPLAHFPIPAIVLGRILAVMFLLTIVAIYFVGEGLGLIPPIFATAQTTPEERRALAKHNSEVKRFIAARNARAADVRAADQADIAIQTARDAPALEGAAKPVAAAAPEPPAPTPAN
jgi:uncharacterized iron-regulated membrane protein